MKTSAIGELVIDGKTGWLVPPGNQEALTEALSGLLERRCVTRQMREEARRVAESRVSPMSVAAALRDCFSRAHRLHGKRATEFDSFNEDSS